MVLYTWPHTWPQSTLLISQSQHAETEGTASWRNNKYVLGGVESSIWAHAADYLATQITTWLHNDLTLPSSDLHLSERDLCSETRHHRLRPYELQLNHSCPDIRSYNTAITCGTISLLSVCIKSTAAAAQWVGLLLFPASTNHATLLWGTTNTAMRQISVWWNQ